MFWLQLRGTKELNNMESKRSHECEIQNKSWKEFAEHGMC
jgi:hypothetical protein